jgi:hypothetical protein
VALAESIPGFLTASLNSVGAANSLTGEFVIPLATIVGPVLAAAVTSWFEGITGRKFTAEDGRHRR